MKFRIRGSSVRVRVTRSEAARLGAGERIEQTTRFSRVASLRSSVEPTSRADAPIVEFVDSALRVLLSSEQLRAWANSDQVTIEARQDVGDQVSLQILVEKDFQCIHSQAEGNSDFFPNPREQQFQTGAASSCHAEKTSN
jgi:hypothetical protein